MHPRFFVRFIALLVFCSGLCALIYQTVWIREFRLIFGSSTAATAAVLGIFMGGLGLGSALLGRRAEKSPAPLLLYGNLEVLIALGAAVTPPLLWLVREIYTLSGGSTVLGHTAGTAVRLMLSTLVLIIPTFLMGGTLPAVARAVSTEEDHARRNLALLYGCNTLGAVTGVLLSTFWLIEEFGNRQTLWLACLFNGLIALVARHFGASRPVLEPENRPEKTPEQAAHQPWRYIAFSAAIVGFAFMIMELVWYRMLSPILGGSTFTFGLILAVALFGIGLGGALYSFLFSFKKPTLNVFGASCALEAFFIAFPYALGDRLALFTHFLGDLDGFGFHGQILRWSIITFIVVFPAALVAGFQFPLLISLLGSGRRGVGNHTGTAYAANTFGAIIGSLLGGFGLLPLLGAPGVWRLVVCVLCALALCTAFIALRKAERRFVFPLTLCGIALALLLAPGPTAAWRHSGIGAGRSKIERLDVNSLTDWVHARRRAITWETDGRESSVALNGESSFSFIVNGKSDGNARADCGTQVMAGLLGAILHPHPRSSLIIGLGTGSTAGWMGMVPEMESVDVIEIEEAILEVAKQCAPVNRDVLGNPKVKVHIDDAREVLLATPRSYDIIFSEPSNPYRAGIASLFTQDFYRSAVRRLNPGGIFIQWVQMYEIDEQALRTAYATLASVFPHVETWMPQSGDIILVASMEPLRMDAAHLRQRITIEPFRSALSVVWGTDQLEGVFSHYLANDAFTRAVVATGAPISTDDRNHLEFGFARTVGRRFTMPLISELQEYARIRNWHRPQNLTGAMDWASADRQNLLDNMVKGIKSQAPFEVEGETRHPWEFLHLASKGDYAAAVKVWRSHSLQPANRHELEQIALCLAHAGDPEALGFIEKIKLTNPTAAQALLARYWFQRKEYAQSAQALQAALLGWKTDPWVADMILEQTILLAPEVARKSDDAETKNALYEAMAKPFAVHMANALRQDTQVRLAIQLPEDVRLQKVAEALDAHGEHFPWTNNFLVRRHSALRARNDPQADRAERDLRNFLNREPRSFEAGMEAAP